eukprot:COSAG02_NODE_1080_length_14710_cov_46.078913_7_plen_86_part_00
MEDLWRSVSFGKSVEDEEDSVTMVEEMLKDARKKKTQKSEENTLSHESSQRAVDNVNQLIEVYKYQHAADTHWFASHSLLALRRR